MCLIFDLDGTLIDSRAGILESLQIASLDIVGIQLNSDMLRIGPPIKTMVKEILPEVSENNVDKIIKSFRVHYDTEGWKNFSVYPNVIETLRELSEKNYLFIATNKPERPTLKILDKMKILNIFEKVFCYSSKRYISKTDMVKEIKSNSTNNYKLIGDSKDDFLAAYNNNIEFLYCSYGYGNIDLSENNIKKNIKQFKDLIKL